MTNSKQFISHTLSALTFANVLSAALVCALACVGLASNVYADADSISINFGPHYGAPTGGNLGAVPVNYQYWNNAGTGTNTTTGTAGADTGANKTGTISLISNTGADTGLTATWNCNNTYRYGGTRPTTTNNAILFYGYLDDSSGNQRFNMTAPYFTYDIYYYATTDSNGFRYATINSVNYYGYNSQTTPGTGNWGTSVKGDISALTEGVNYLKVSSSDSLITISGVAGQKVNNKNYRGSFGALQIVNTANSLSTTTAENSLVLSSSAISWYNDLTGATAQVFDANAFGYRILYTGTEDTFTVDLNGAASLPNIKLIGSATNLVFANVTLDQLGETGKVLDLSGTGANVTLPAFTQIAKQGVVKLGSNVTFAETPADTPFITGAYFADSTTSFACIQDGVVKAVDTVTSASDGVNLRVASKIDDKVNNQYVERTFNSLITEADYVNQKAVTITSGMITLQRNNHWVQGGGTITSGYQNADGEYDLYICGLGSGLDMRINGSTIVDNPGYDDGETVIPAGKVNVIKTGKGIVSLSNATSANTYSGKTMVLEGKLQIGEAIRSTEFYVATNAQLDFSSRNYKDDSDFPDVDHTATSLSGYGTVEIGNANGKISMTLDNVANDGSKFARVNAYGKSLTMDNSELHTAVMDSKTPITLTNSSIVADTFISSADSSVVFDATSTLDAPIVTSAGALTLDIPADRNLSYAPTGAGGITKAGAGTLTLTEEPGYTGNTTINAGKLVTTAGGTLYNLSGASAGTLDNNGQAITVNNSSNTAFAGVITGAGSLTKTGTGKLEISKDINYTGNTTVSEGTLQINGASDDGKRFRGTITIANGAKLICNAHDSLGYSDAVENVFNIYGTMDNASGNESFSNTTFNLYGGTISSTGGGSLDILAANDKIFTFALDGASATAPTVSTISSNIRLRADNQTLEIDTAANTQLKISGVISASNATQSITKLGAGTLTLSGYNTFTGDTFVNAGTLELTATGGTATLPKGRAVTVDGATSVLAGHGDILGYTSGAIGSLTLINGGTFKNDAAGTHITVNNPIYMNNGIIAAEGAGTDSKFNFYFDNAIHVTGGTNNAITAAGIRLRALDDTTFVSGDSAGLIDVAADAKLTISSVIETSSNAALTKSGAGELVLTSASDSFTKGATISQGALTLEESGTLGTGAVAIAENAVLNLNHEGTARFDNSVTGVEVDSEMGYGKIYKNGNGVLKIYNPTEDAFAAESFVVNAGELDFKGYFKGVLEIGDGAVFSPGNSVGKLEQTGNFILDSGAILLMEIGGSDAELNDQLVVTGVTSDDGNIILTPGAIIELVMADNSSLNPGDTFTAILDAKNSSDIADDFIANYVRSYYFTDLKYEKVNGTYAITGRLDPNAVPEPSTWALLILGALGLLYCRKRSK